jgi:hypothetical protein
MSDEPVAKDAQIGISLRFIRSWRPEPLEITLARDRELLRWHARKTLNQLLDDGAMHPEKAAAIWPFVVQCEAMGALD